MNASELIRFWVLPFVPMVITIALFIIPRRDRQSEAVIEWRKGVDDSIRASTNDRRELAASLEALRQRIDKSLVDDLRSRFEMQTVINTKYEEQLTNMSRCLAVLLDATRVMLDLQGDSPEAKEASAEIRDLQKKSMRI